MGVILGLETSCDETAAAVVRDGREVLSSVVASQVDAHRAYGGVVPEIAFRKHLELVNPVLDDALRQAGVGFGDLDGVAVSNGPGLVGALLVGVAAAKAVAAMTDLPLLGINHLEAHVYANFLQQGTGVNPEGLTVGSRTDSPTEGRGVHPEGLTVGSRTDSPTAGRGIFFPLVCLLVSGGHTILLAMAGHGRYRYLGETRDDAAGEAFDKVARCLGLGYPGGPVVDRLAREGDPTLVPFPRAWMGEDSLEFSFSGLKTSVVRFMQSPAAAATRIEDICAGFQEAVVEVLVGKTMRAAAMLGVRTVLLAGGVACNSRLRTKMAEACAERELGLHYPGPGLCTDNALMVACAGHYRLEAGLRSGWDLDCFPVLPVGAWPS